MVAAIVIALASLFSGPLHVTQGCGYSIRRRESRINEELMIEEIIKEKVDQLYGKLL